MRSGHVGSRAGEASLGTRPLHLGAASLLDHCRLILDGLEGIDQCLREEDRDLERSSRPAVESKSPPLERIVASVTYKCTKEWSNI